MSTFLHSLAILWSRFRTEILAFGLLVLAACAAPFTGLGPRVMVALAGLETLLLFWITLRILLGEDGFKTSGGWRTRPIPFASLLLSQFALLALVLIPPLLLHAGVVHLLFQPSPQQWQSFLSGGILKTLVGWLVFVTALKLFSAFILRPLEGIARKAAWSVLVIVLVPVLLVALPDGLQQSPGGRGGSGEAPRELAQGIQQLLPDTTEFIGEWNDSGPEAMDPILAYRPWADSAWENVIRAFLLRHATEVHKPALLERLALDPQLTSFFIEKGWSRDAIPVLRHRAMERLPLDTASLKLLAEQNDPDLAPDLAALAHRLNRGVGELAPALRSSAGFDWPAFVREGWKQRKYGEYEREGWLYAIWAAELGDPSALRRLAERTAEGMDWERKQLVRLIPAAPADIIPYLRQNLPQLTHDPATATWR